MGLSEIDLGPGITIPFNNTVESLGVLLDRTLSWIPQIDRMILKANRVLYTYVLWGPAPLSCSDSVLFKLWFSLTSTTAAPSYLTPLMNKRPGFRNPYRERLNWMRTDTRRIYSLAYFCINFLIFAVYLICLICSVHENFSVRQGRLLETLKFSRCTLSLVSDPSDPEESFCGIPFLKKLNLFWVYHVLRALSDCTYIRWINLNCHVSYPSHCFYISSPRR